MILGQQWPLREPPSQQKRRRRESHRCIYRKTRPHNTRFGERIIKEPRCAGACVPVFWLTLCKQASPRMNQRWDAGPTPWHTRTESAPAAFSCTLTFLPNRTELKVARMGPRFWLNHFLSLTRSRWACQRRRLLTYFESTHWILVCRQPARFAKLKMKKFLQNKKGRYSFRQSKWGSRYPAKDFCKSCCFSFLARDLAKIPSPACFLMSSPVSLRIGNHECTVQSSLLPLHIA